MKILYVVVALSYSLFALVFVRESNVSPYVNYFIFLSSIIIISTNRINGKSLLIFICFLIFTLLNYFFAMQADLKHVFNVIGFAFVSLGAFTVGNNLKYHDDIKFQNLIRKNIVILVGVMSALVVYALLQNINAPLLIIDLNFDKYFDLILSTPYGAMEAGFGNFVVFFALITILTYSKNKFRYNLFYITSLLLFIPLTLSHRSIIAALLLFLLIKYLIYKKLPINIIIKPTFFVLICVFIFIIKDELWEFDRMASILVSLDILSQNIFGVGVGGYEKYVLEASYLLEKYGNELQLKVGYFWRSPESDLVNFIASWGVLGFIIYIFLIRILHQCFKLLSDNKIKYTFDKLIIYFYMYLIFAGITSFKSNWVIWWLTFGLVSGVIYRINRDSNINILRNMSSHMPIVRQVEGQVLSNTKI
jgi:hypothetical protein